MEDVDAWKEIKAEIEARPHVEGRYDIRFNGEPEAYDHTFVCPDCHRTLRARGISFGPHQPDLSVAGHQLDDCPAWRNRLWRFRHHTLWRLGLRHTLWRLGLRIQQLFTAPKAGSPAQSSPSRDDLNEV